MIFIWKIIICVFSLLALPVFLYLKTAKGRRVIDVLGDAVLKSDKEFSTGKLLIYLRNAKFILLTTGLVNSGRRYY